MSKPVPAIRSVKARGLVVPLARPVKNAFGVIDVGPLVLIDVETDQGVTGHSYIFAYARLTLKPLVHLIEEIGRELTGKPVAPYDLMAAMDAKFRLLGWQGPRRHGGVRPRHGLLGRARPDRAVGRWPSCSAVRRGRSGPMTAMAWSIPSADEKALRRSLEPGFSRHQDQGRRRRCRQRRARGQGRARPARP